MPTASRKERKKRRIKRTNTLLKKALRMEYEARAKAHILLLAVLAQKGGEITVTKGTLTQVTTELKKLAYGVTEVEGEYVVKLITQEPAEETAPDPSQYDNPGQYPPDEETPSQASLMDDVPEEAS